MEFSFKGFNGISTWTDIVLFLHCHYSPVQLQEPEQSNFDNNLSFRRSILSFQQLLEENVAYSA